MQLKTSVTIKNPNLKKPILSIRDTVIFAAIYFIVKSLRRNHG